MPPTPTVWDRLSDYLLVRRAQQTVVAVLLLVGLAATAVWWYRQGGFSGGLVDYDERPRREAAFVVDVNRAGSAELAELPGVGDTLARRIVEHRSEHGPFKSWDDLGRVKGIGVKTLEGLRPHVRFE